MNVSTVSIDRHTLRSRLSVALALCALTALGARAHAAELDPITINPPTVVKIDRDPAFAPTEKVTVTASIAVDAETLRNKSGVVLLKDRVREAAREACAAADPTELDDGTCVYNAVKGAKPQVAAAIARARAPA